LAYLLALLALVVESHHAVRHRDYQDTGLHDIVCVVLQLVLISGIIGPVLNALVRDGETHEHDNHVRKSQYCLGVEVGLLLVEGRAGLALPRWIHLWVLMLLLTLHAKFYQI